MFWLAGTLGLIGLILGFIARAIKRGEATNGTAALWGIITSALALPVGKVLERPGKPKALMAPSPGSTLRHPPLNPTPPVDVVARSTPRPWMGDARMRKVLALLLAIPFLVLFGAPAAQAQACEIVPETLADGNVGTEGTWFITVTGCSSSQKLPSFKVVDGSLPDGTKLFNFATSTGLIFGTPKTEGTFTFTIEVKDETRATDTETFSITILPPPPLVVTTETLSNGTVGEFYCCGNLFASGGVPGYTWSVVSGELPPGLELPRRENTISGTPTMAGTFMFTVQVTDERGTTTEKAFTITIN